MTSGHDLTSVWSRSGHLISSQHGAYRHHLPLPRTTFPKNHNQTLTSSPVRPSPSKGLLLLASFGPKLPLPCRPAVHQLRGPSSPSALASTPSRHHHLFLLPSFRRHPAPSPPPPPPRPAHHQAPPTTHLDQRRTAILIRGTAAAAAPQHMDARRPRRRACGVLRYARERSRGGVADGAGGAGGAVGGGAGG